MGRIRDWGRISEFPKLELDNGELRARVYLPDPVRGYYRGVRFDRSGLIEQVETADHRYFAPLHAVHEPERHDSVCGPAEEFASVHPMGFAEADAGGAFVKIGVGLLRKGEDPEYRFDGNYELLRPGVWTVDCEAHRVSFEQDFDGEGGWAYRYRKVLRLVVGARALVIEHALENRGRRVIDVNNYNHNFILIDGRPYGPDYRVEFPFQIPPRSGDEHVRFSSHAVEMKKPLGERSLWFPLFEGDAPARDNRARVRSLSTGASVEFQGDAALSRMVLWAVERAVCPEPFIRIHLIPGQTKSWSSHYLFS